MKENKNIEYFDWELLAKYLNDEVNSKEKSEVESWLKQSENNQEEMKQNIQMLHDVDGYYKSKSFDSQSAWNKVDSKLNSTQLKVVQHKKLRKERFAEFYKYAAVLVVAILLGGVGYYFGFSGQFPSFQNEIVSAEIEVLKEYVLPDGSMVTLNSNSKMEFPKQFASDVREVTIIGEAFFDVKPNPEKPFIIHAGGTNVKVLGTSFNVCAYPETEMVEVVVKTGKVQVSRNSEDSFSGKKEVFLNPGEKGTLSYRNQILEKSVNTDVNYLAWKTNDIIFNETPLGEVVRCLEKVYHIEIDVVEPELKDLVLTAHFDKKPVDFVLNVVRLTFNLELTGENEHFALSSRINEQEKL